MDSPDNQCWEVGFPEFFISLQIPDFKQVFIKMSHVFGFRIQMTVSNLSNQESIAGIRMKAGNHMERKQGT